MLDTQKGPTTIETHLHPFDPLAASVHGWSKFHSFRRTMITHNAEANAPMRSINQRLGFAVHRQDATYQIGRETLEEAGR